MSEFFPDMDPELTQWREELTPSLNKTVVMIPARSGSTRIKDKNIIDVCGSPLLAYTARIATRLKGVDRVIINTDSKKYARIAERYGVEAPFIRPSALADTKVSMSWAHRYASVNFVKEGYPVRTIITLTPTNPFRNLQQIQQLVDLSNKYGYVQSCFMPQVDPANTFYSDESDLCRLTEASSVPPGPTVKMLGHFSGSATFIKLYRKKDIYNVVTNPMELVDIDVDGDLALTRHIVENNLYDFGVADQ